MLKVNLRSLPSFVSGLSLCLWTTPLLAASGSGLPWESSLTTIVNSLTGPVALLISTVAIIITGFAVMFSEGGSMMRRAAGVGLGISIVAGSTTILANVFGLTTGAAF